MTSTLVPHPPTSPSSTSVTGAEIVLRTLEAEGIEVCFGMPGGAILPIYDALARGTTIRHVLVRHEQGAGHMAQGYARASGRPGVVLATSGPGATNLLTPIADAKMDSTPLVCITGQVRMDLIGTDAFQECDIVAVAAPLVKGAWQVRDPGAIAGTLRRALIVARTGRPGPVVVDIPRNVQEAVLRDEPADTPVVVAAPGPPAHDELERAAEAIAVAERPVLYVGGGAQSCAGEVRALAERAQLPVVTTLMGKGAFDEDSSLFVGWPGMHGTKAANWTLNHADLIVAAGARFDDRVTGRVDLFAPHAKVVHIDVDKRELGKIKQADVAIHSYLGPALEGITEGLGAPPTHRDVWHQRIEDWRQRFPLGHADTPLGGMLKPQELFGILARATAKLDDVIWTTGVGQHQMWAMQYLPVRRARSFVTSGGLGTMGYGLPAALGAKVARPGATVLCVDGDGSFQMTLQELGTAVAERLQVIVVLVNNGRLGMVDQWQTMFYDERKSASDLRPGMPSFATIAQGYGATGREVRTAPEVEEALAEALGTPGPTVIDVQVDPEEACFPMILPGGAAVEQVEWHERLP